MTTKSGPPADILAAMLADVPATSIEALIERARRLPAEHMECLADHLLDQLATPAGGLAVLRAAATLNLEAASTALSTFERECSQVEAALAADAFTQVEAALAADAFTPDEAAISLQLRELDTQGWPVFRSVAIPSYGQYPAGVLYEARTSDVVTSGLCATVEEASARIVALAAGRELSQAPAGQANRREMQQAWERLQVSVPRDGGLTIEAVRAALAAGIHTVEWAIASRHIASMFA